MLEGQLLQPYKEGKGNHFDWNRLPIDHLRPLPFEYRSFDREWFDLVFSGTNRRIPKLTAENYVYTDAQRSSTKYPQTLKEGQTAVRLILNKVQGQVTQISNKDETWEYTIHQPTTLTHQESIEGKSGYKTYTRLLVERPC